MHRTYSVPRLLGCWSLVLALTLLAGLSAAKAQQPLLPLPVQPASFQPEIIKDGPMVSMQVGGTQFYQMKGAPNLKSVVNSNQKVLNVSAVKGDPTKVEFQALTPGTSKVEFTDVNGNKEIVNVFVISDRVKELREAISRAVPTASVSVSSTDSGNTVIVAGTVLTADDARIIQQLTGTAGVVNNVKIGGVQTVQLEVLIAVVNRSEARNMAFSFSQGANNWFFSSIFGAPLAFTNSIATAAAANSANLTQTGAANIPFGILNSKGSFLGFIQALRTENLAKIIAEPRVTTLSGRPAYIVSGGETPLLTSSGQGAPSITYKQFGTVVNFLPIVLGNGKIHLEVRPEVSDIDTTLGISIPGITPTIVPGFRTRSAQVAVQMEDGQTLAIGGLIQNNINASITRIPVLGDMPFLGTLFTQKSFTETEQELVILVTPRLVDPVDCTKIPRYLPGRETRSPDDFELFLEGIMEAPRGPRTVNFHPQTYKAAHTYAPSVGVAPAHNGGISSDHVSISRPMPSPAFPEVPGVLTSNPRPSAEVELVPPTPVREVPGLGPVVPAPLPPLSREQQPRPVLPPINPR
jgi:pilus assembly protein CpaC